MQSKRHIDEQPSFETETPLKKQQKNNDLQGDSNSRILQETLALAIKPSLETYISTFKFLDEKIKNKYAQYDKLLFLKLIKCIKSMRNLTLSAISRNVCGAESPSMVYDYVSHTSSYWIRQERKMNLLNYLFNNQDILRFYIQAGKKTGVDHEKDVQLLIDYQDKNLSIHNLNHLDEPSKGFQQQIRQLDENIQISQQVNVRNANQQFIAIFNDKKTFDRVLEESQQRTFNWPATDLSKRSIIITKSESDLNLEFDTRISTFQFADGKNKNLYVKYEKFLFLKLIKCIQHIHHFSLNKISRLLHFPSNAISNYVSEFSEDYCYITPKFKKSLLAYLDNNPDILDLYKEIGTEIQLDHEKDIQLFRTYQDVDLSDKKSYRSCQQDNNFQQQIRHLYENIQVSQQLDVHNANQQFIAAFIDKKTFDRVVEEPKIQTYIINLPQISEENTEGLSRINGSSANFSMSNPPNDNLPSETINQLYEKYLSQTEGEVDSQVAQFINPEDDLLEEDMLEVTTQFYKEYYQPMDGIQDIANNTTAAKGYQNYNLFAEQPKTTQTTLLPKPGNTE